MSAFAMVAELRGFAPAARRLKLSPSAITRLVAALEEYLELQLLQRTTRSVTLTDAGARYLESARRILAAVDEAEDSARAERTEPRGKFVVAAPNVFGRCEVAPLMCEFLAKYPGVVGQLTLADRMVNLIDEGVDLAVRIGMLEDSSLRARVVGKTRTMVLSYQVADCVRNGSLQIVLPKYELAALPIQLVHPASRLVSANVRAFVDLALTTRTWSFVDL